MAKTDQAPQVAPKSFEEAMGELEKILGEIEKGDVPLEESLKKYERGTFLIAHCRQVLGQAERQVEMLTREGGELKTVPMQ